ncbi:hypothetical protein ACH5RR_029903 [Cinchona calisaya]|uniref:Uncharacterized protein n=1 Tax=Cinchona calisaya TaxID=153742 RepID=A0ABD2YWC2_9GENT
MFLVVKIKGQSSSPFFYDYLFIYLFPSHVDIEYFLTNRRKKIVAGSLMEVMIRLGGGELAPANGDQFKMKPKCIMERRRPVSMDDRFLKDSELHFEIELIDFSKVKASISHQLNFLM